MMNLAEDSNLPKIVNPKVLARQQKCFKLRLDMRHFSRLMRNNLVSSKAGLIAWTDVSLRFWMDDFHRLFLTGQLSALLAIECQRCLKPMEQPLEAAFKYRIIEKATTTCKTPVFDLEDPLETLEITDDKLDLLNVLEDELILSLPFAPSHENCQLSYQQAHQTDSEQAGQLQPARKYPFEILRQMKSGAATPETTKRQ